MELPHRPPIFKLSFNDQLKTPGHVLPKNECVSPFSSSYLPLEGRIRLLVFLCYLYVFISINTEG